MDNNLKENVALLEMLDQYPDPAGKNPVPPAVEQSPQPNRSLSLKHERAIVENFILLADYTDDPLKVFALCIEEHPAGDGMTVRIAINTSDRGLLQQGLRMIGVALEKVAQQGTLTSNQL